MPLRRLGPIGPAPTWISKSACRGQARPAGVIQRSRPALQEGLVRYSWNWLTDMAKRKHSALGKRLIASAKEMVAHAKGELKLEEYEVRLPPRLTSSRSATS